MLIPASPQALVAKAGCPGRFGRLGGAGKVFQEQEVTDWLPGKAGIFPRSPNSEKVLGGDQARDEDDGSFVHPFPCPVFLASTSCAMGICMGELWRTGPSLPPT